MKPRVNINTRGLKSEAKHRYEDDDGDDDDREDDVIIGKLIVPWQWESGAISLTNTHNAGL